MRTAPLGACGNAPTRPGSRPPLASGRASLPLPAAAPRGHSASVPKEKGEMQSNADQHIFVTGACGAGKSTLAKGLSHQLQLPLHRLDDDPDFRQMVPMVECHPAEFYRETDPPWYARWQALRRHLVQEAVKLPQPHIIEGTHILAAPELTTGHRRILVDTPVHQIIRQYLARGRAHQAGSTARDATRHPGAPGSVAARDPAVPSGQIY